MHSMNEDVIADLKQFITATVSQQISGLRNDMDQGFDGLRNEMNHRFDEVDRRFQRVGQRFDDLEAKVDTIADAQAVDLADHEQRLTKLEQQAA